MKGTNTAAALMLSGASEAALGVYTALKLVAHVPRSINDVLPPLHTKEAGCASSSVWYFL